MEVKKRDGTTERFDRSKLERSIRSAGADEKAAKEIAKKIREREGITTSEIRETILKELEKVNRRAAETYRSTRRLAARKAVEAAKGTARLGEETMKRLNIQAGQRIEVSHGAKTHKVTVERSPKVKKDIHLHNEDLETLGASEGARVLVRTMK